MYPNLYRVKQSHQDTHDTFTVELEPTNGAKRFSFDPGQFNMVYIFGVGEAPISISSAADLDAPLMHTTREVGVVTRAMRTLKRGDVLGIRGPFGKGWPVEKALGRDVIIVAGGIGLAPLRPALYQLIQNRDKFGKIVLLYGTRSPEDILYTKELKQWRAQFDLEIHVTVDRAIGQWRGNVGVVTSLIPKAPFDPVNSTAFVCGPEVMMRFTTQALQRRGMERSHIYLSLERNMKCGVGFCGHCQHGPDFVCKDGPVFRYDAVEEFFGKAEV